MATPNPGGWGRDAATPSPSTAAPRLPRGGDSNDTRSRTTYRTITSGAVAHRSRRLVTCRPTTGGPGGAGLQDTGGRRLVSSSERLGALGSRPDAALAAGGVNDAESGYFSCVTPGGVVPPAASLPERHFCSKTVEELLERILDAKLYNAVYDVDTCAQLARETCLLIKDKTKELEFSRYKLVTQVVLGQDTEQDVQVASRCLWNHETDDFAAASYRNKSLYAVAIVYGMYLD